MGPWTGGAAGGTGGGTAGGPGAGAEGVVRVTEAADTWAGAEEVVWIGTGDGDFLCGGVGVWYEVLVVGWDIDALCFPLDVGGVGAGPLDTGGVGSEPGGCGEDRDRPGTGLG